MQTKLLHPDPKGLADAAALLRAGETVAFPTETVYGLGADARNGRAVAAIYAAKDRPRFNPLIVHVATRAQAERHGVFSAQARALADAFWPGPLTLVVPRRPDTPVSALVSAGHDTIALRMPASPTARSLLLAFDGPIAGPSANPSGRISPTSADHVLAGLAGRIGAVLDGGPCPVGVESTIVGMRAEGPVLLRAGGLPAEAIEAVLGRALHRNQPNPNATPGPNHPPDAPGQLASHYAPNARLRLNASAPESDELWLGFGPDAHGGETLSATGDLAEAAANLFALLHRLDATGAPRIAVAPIPDHGLGAAINDRLSRAAAPR